MHLVRPFSRPRGSRRGTVGTDCQSWTICAPWHPWMTSLMSIPSTTWGWTMASAIPLRPRSPSSATRRRPQLPSTLTTPLACAPARSRTLTTCALPPHRCLLPLMRRKKRRFTRTTCTTAAGRLGTRTVRLIPGTTSLRTTSPRASNSQTTLAWVSRPALVPFPWVRSTILLPGFIVALVWVTCSPPLAQISRSTPALGVRA